MSTSICRRTVTNAFHMTVRVCVSVTPFHPGVDGRQGEVAANVSAAILRVPEIKRL